MDTKAARKRIRSEWEQEAREDRQQEEGIELRVKKWKRATTTAAEILDADGQIHFPDGAGFGQIQKIVTNYLNEHPEEWEKPASFLVRKALKKAWGKE